MKILLWKLLQLFYRHPISTVIGKLTGLKLSKRITKDYINNTRTEKYFFQRRCPDGYDAKLWYNVTEANGDLKLCKFLKKKGVEYIIFPDKIILGSTLEIDNNDEYRLLVALLNGRPIYGGPDLIKMKFPVKEIGGIYFNV